MKLSHIVTHAGRAHRDEFYAVGLALHIFGPYAVWRRIPTEEELNSPKVLVLDVGGRHEPELLNFDHHQLPKEQLDCTLSLMAKHFYVDPETKAMTFHELWKDAPWYKAVILQDTKGPAGMAKFLGLDSMPPEFMSGVELFCLQEFARGRCMGGPEEFEVVDHYWCKFCTKLIQAKIRTAQDFIKQQKLIAANHEVRVIKRHRIPWMKSIVVFWAPEAGVFGLNAYIEKSKIRVDITITKDPRTGGLSLYRLHDDGPFDFSKLEGMDNVLYADHRGFLATAERDTPWSRIEALIVLSYDAFRLEKG